MTISLEGKPQYFYPFPLICLFDEKFSCRFPFKTLRTIITLTDLPQWWWWLIILKLTDVSLVNTQQWALHWAPLPQNRLDQLSITTFSFLPSSVYPIKAQPDPFLPDKHTQQFNTYGQCSWHGHLVSPSSSLWKDHKKMLKLQGLWWKRVSACLPFSFQVIVVEKFNFHCQTIFWFGARLT